MKRTATLAAFTLLLACAERETGGPVRPTPDGGMDTDAGARIGPRIQITDCAMYTADGGRGCRGPTHDVVVDFGPVDPDACVEATVRITNTGDAALEVEAPVLAPGASPNLSFSGEAPRAFSLPAATAGQQPSQTLVLRYCNPISQPSCGVPGALRLYSNDPVLPRLDMTVIAADQGVPQPRCVCQPDSIEASVGETIWLNASCTSACARPLMPRWSIEQRPSGSTAGLQSATSATTSIVLDAATFETPYIFRATATDGYGRRAACDVRAQATRVVPPDGLRVELTRQEDETDVDLHLLNPTSN